MHFSILGSYLCSTCFSPLPFISAWFWCAVLFSLSLGICSRALFTGLAFAVWLCPSVLPGVRARAIFMSHPSCTIGFTTVVRAVISSIVIVRICRSRLLSARWLGLLSLCGAYISMAWYWYLGCNDCAGVCKFGGWHLQWFQDGRVLRRYCVDTA